MDMKCLIRYNGEFVAATKYLFDARLVYDDLLKRGKEHETVYPFKIVLSMGNEIVDVYTSTKPLTTAQLEAMIKEYGR